MQKTKTLNAFVKEFIDERFHDMKTSKKVLSLLLSVLLVFSSVSLILFAGADDENPNELNFAGMSDVHFYPKSLTGGDSEEWKDFCTSKSKEFEQSEAITDAALDSIALKSNEGLDTKYLLISGDLTKDGEYQGHKELAEKLENFEKNTGIQVIVINGNHDINNSDACDFSSGTKVSAKMTTPEDFRNIYADLGYDIADDFYTPPEGTIQGGLSYTVDLAGNFYLICVDSCEYESGEHKTDGMITDDLLKWIDDEADKAEAEGQEVMLMMHHNINSHMKLEHTVTWAFTVEDYDLIAENFAEHNIHFTFTGHQHSNDINKITADNGSVLYDCEIGSMIGFPNEFREFKATRNASTGVATMDYSLGDCDYAHPIVDDGITYARPFKHASFGINYGGNNSPDGRPDMTRFINTLVDSYLKDFLQKIKDEGGINQFLINHNIDLSSYIKKYVGPYIGDGIKIGNINLFTLDNINWFVQDLLNQVDEQYIDNPQATMNLLYPIIEKVMTFKLSDIPCDKYYDTYGIGSKTRGGTLGDFALCAVLNWTLGDETDENDAFEKDVLDNFKNGDLSKRLINFLLDIVYNDILRDDILARLDVRLESLADSGTTGGKIVAKNLKYIEKKILKDDTSYLNLVDTFFSLNAVDYTSLWDIADKLFISKYMTDSQWEQIANELYTDIDDFINDSNPKVKGDRFATYTSAYETPEATKENYRLPSMINETIGEDASSEATVTWFTKSTVTGTDIEIYPADDYSSFKGVSNADTSSVTVSASSEQVTYQAPGIDFSVIGFFNDNVYLTRHTIKLSNLKSGEKYLYRVGDESKGWWSETCETETADNSDSVTFFHMSDPQSGNREQYDRTWKKVLSAAFKLYPDAKFVLNTGDLVDNGGNETLWHNMFDSGANNLTKTYLMPVSGNHENFGKYATVSYFDLPNVPEQDTKSGVYYSFDYNNVHVSVLNANDLNSDSTLSDKQIEWLKKDIAGSSDAEWHIVATHKAVYSNGSHFKDKDVKAMRTQLGKLMPELGIDLVLEGHDHVYTRTYSMDSNSVVDSKRVKLNHNGETYIADVSPKGTTYLISGTSGVKVYNAVDASETDEYFPRAEKYGLAAKPMFTSVQITGDTLYADAYFVDSDGNTELADNFAITKNDNIESSESYAGDADDVKASEHKMKSAFVLKIEKFFNTLKKVFKVLKNLLSRFISIGS